MPKESSNQIPILNEKRDPSLDPIVFVHLFGVIGDWYICEISEDRSIAYGYKNIEAEEEWEMEEWIPNSKGWESFSIGNLQKLVNNEFLKEKDIRFLIVRDVYWEPVKFSSLNINKQTLNYPGSIN
tara:strand:- start:2474 stop:2851 length:378 start_codon:yes stop_codon:yes gene_type:complete